MAVTTDGPPLSCWPWGPRSPPLPPSPSLTPHLQTSSSPPPAAAGAPTRRFYFMQSSRREDNTSSLKASYEETKVKKGCTASEPQSPDVKSKCEETMTQKVKQFAHHGNRLNKNFPAVVWAILTIHELLTPGGHQSSGEIWKRTSENREVF
ncbi:uncharacterized protein LOC144221996 [Crocuta crocuta]